MKKDIFIQQIRASAEQTFEAAVCAQKMQTLNQAYIQSGIQAVYQNEPNNLSEIVKSYRKLRKVIAGLQKTEKEVFIYECGIFNGAYKIFEELGMLYLEHEERRDSQKLLERKHVFEILDYLYKNPDARHGKIAEDITVSPNQLSEILKWLLDAGYIQRYGQHKGTRYSLTKAGRLIYRTYTVRKEKRNARSYIDIDYEEIQKKEKFLQERACETAKSNLKKEDRNEKWKFDFKIDTEVKRNRQELGDLFSERGTRNQRGNFEAGQSALWIVASGAEIGK